MAVWSYSERPMGPHGDSRICIETAYQENPKFGICIEKHYMYPEILFLLGGGLQKMDSWIICGVQNCSKTSWGWGGGTPSGDLRHEILRRTLV